MLCLNGVAGVKKKNNNFKFRKIHSSIQKRGGPPTEIKARWVLKENHPCVLVFIVPTHNTGNDKGRVALCD